MVIKRETLEKEGKIAEVRKYGTFQARILAYLKKAEHIDSAFTQGEIAKAFATSEQQARLTLMSLVRKGLVVRMEHPYEIEYVREDGSKVMRTFFAIVYMANK